MPGRGVAQTIDMIGGGLAEPAADNHPVAIPSASVADRTINIESLAAALEQRAPQNGAVGLFVRRRKPARVPGVDRLVGGVRDLTDKPPLLFAGVEELVVTESAARDGPLHQRPGREPVAEEVALLQRLIPRLVVHVEPVAAAQQRQERDHEREGCTQAHGGTS
jgi:hypothetical protein